MDVPRIGLRDVATHAGVSVATVSNVLNGTGRFSESTRERVERAVTELGFARNRAAVELRTRQRVLIGLTLPDLTNPFFARVARAVIAEATRRGLLVVVLDSEGSEVAQAHQLTSLIAQQVTGIIVLPVLGAESLLRAWSPSAGAALVFVDDSAPEGFDSVAADNRAGGALAARHAIECGGRSVAFVAPDVGSVAVQERFEGARDEAAVHGVRVEWVAIEGFGVDDGVESVARMSAEGAAVDAVLAVNDLVAVGVSRAVVGTALERAVIVGYDDLAAEAAAELPFATVRQPVELIGRLAVARLAGDGEGQPTRVTLPPELVIRG